MLACSYFMEPLGGHFVNLTKNDQQVARGMPDPILVAVGTAATLRAQNADAPRKRRCFHRSPRPSVSSPDFGICRGRNSELPKSGIDVVGHMVSWRVHLCPFYETGEEASILSMKRPFQFARKFQFVRKIEPTLLPAWPLIFRSC